MTNIYDKHDAAFNRVSAWVIIDTHETAADLGQSVQRFGTVAIKYPADGAGRLTAFVHFFGTQMQSGTASGYGYDKSTAAVHAAVAKIDRDESDPRQLEALAAFRAAAHTGTDWQDILRTAGFSVLQAV